MNVLRETGDPATTVVALDASWSIRQSDQCGAIRRGAPALALASAARADRVRFIAFSAYARWIERQQAEQLGTDESVLGSNLHAAMLLAEEEFIAADSHERRFIALTDGEFTSHLIDDKSYYAYPPVPRTVGATIDAARRLTQAGVRLCVIALPMYGGRWFPLDRLEQEASVEVVLSGAARIAVDAWQALRS